MIQRPRFQPDALAAILQAWRRAGDVECCGLLVGCRHAAAVRIVEAIEAPNVHPQPDRAFAIAPEVQAAAARAARVRSLEVLGAWHGHLQGPPVPGRADAENVMVQARVAGVPRWMVIIGRGAGTAPVVRCYVHADGVLRETGLVSVRSGAGLR